MRDQIIEYAIGLLLGFLIYALLHPYMCKDPNCSFKKWWFTR